MEELPVLPLRRGRPTVGPGQRKPEWLKIELHTGENLIELKEIMRGRNLHTVCEEARCPNQWECWNHRTATFMILGDVCTRACGFCAVLSGKPTELDEAEPERVADAVVAMGLRYVVVTSVARDDLADGGAAIFAETVRAIRRRQPDCQVEVLIPDFEGNAGALRVVMDARPDVLNHNIETVRRLTPYVRSRAQYDRTLDLLRRARQFAPEIPTKSGMMLGLGETREEVLETLADLRAAGVDILTIGQYLQPTVGRHLQVVRYVPPAEFAEYRQAALDLGFKHCESGPLVRSSYHAWEQAASARGTAPPAHVEGD